MARRTFFSFHYEKDVQRAAVVRNSSLTYSGISPEWIDASIWEEAKLKNAASIERLIADALYGTSVTAVLIGSNTSQRPWVKYEIEQSLARGNALIGIRIHNIRDFNGRTSSRGNNPLPTGYPVYDWVDGDGYSNLGEWVRLA